MIRKTLLAGFFFLSSIPVMARPRAPIPFNALDSGVVSAESLGRGDTIASNRATPAAGSENPASLADSRTNSSYTTVLLKTASSLDADTAKESDPLTGKVLQYIAIQGEKGVIFYEPVSRLHQRTILSAATPSTDYRLVDYSANAIGFAGASAWGHGSIGLGFSYLWSNIAVQEHLTGVPDKTTIDTAEGVRMNIGVRYPVGVYMFGAMLQNAPGFMWGKHYAKETMPFRARLGNTVKVTPGILFSLDYERRFYRDRDNSQGNNYVYIGNESYLSSQVVLRLGTFGTNIGKPEERHVTGGLTAIAKTGLQVSYALEVFQELDQKVRRHLLSVQFPFENEDDSTKR